MRLCISVNYGEASVTIWYAFHDLASAELPKKEDSMVVSQMLIKSRIQLEDYKQRQEELADLEKNSLRFNDVLDERLIWVTVLEVLLILLVFLAELIVLNKYLKYQEIV